MRRGVKCCREAWHLTIGNRRLGQPTTNTSFIGREPKEWRMDTKCEAWDIYYHFFILSPPSRRRDIGGEQHKEWGRDWSVIVTAAGLWNISTDWQTVPGLTNVFVFVFQAASWQKDIGLHLLVIPAAYLLTNDIKPNTSCPASSNCHPDNIVEEMVLILFLWAKLAFSLFIGGRPLIALVGGHPLEHFILGGESLVKAIIGVLGNQQQDGVGHSSKYSG